VIALKGLPGFSKCPPGLPPPRGAHPLCVTSSSIAAHFDFGGFFVGIKKRLSRVVVPCRPTKNTTALGPKNAVAWQS
jgi:hypothetical protein